MKISKNTKLIIVFANFLLFLFILYFVWIRFLQPPLTLTGGNIENYTGKRITIAGKIDNLKGLKIFPLTNSESYDICPPSKGNGLFNNISKNVVLTGFVQEVTENSNEKCSPMSQWPCEPVSSNCILVTEFKVY